MLFQSFHVLVNQWSISHWQCYPTGEWTWSILGSLTRPIELQWIPGSKVWTDSESIIISNQLITPTPIQIGFVGSVVGYTDDTSPIPFIAGTLPKPWIQCIYCSTAGLFGMSRNWGRTTHRRIPFFFRSLIGCRCYCIPLLVSTPYHRPKFDWAEAQPRCTGHHLAWRSPVIPWSGWGGKSHFPNKYVHSYILFHGLPMLTFPHHHISTGRQSACTWGIAPSYLKIVELSFQWCCHGFAAQAKKDHKNGPGLIHFTNKLKMHPLVPTPCRFKVSIDDEWIKVFGSQQKLFFVERPFFQWDEIQALRNNAISSATDGPGS